MTWYGGLDEEETVESLAYLEEQRALHRAAHPDVTVTSSDGITEETAVARVAAFDDARVLLRFTLDGVIVAAWFGRDGVREDAAWQKIHPEAVWPGETR